MSTSSNRVLDELAKFMTDAAGATQGLRREAETVVRSQAERFMGEMDLVKRDDFDAVMEMAIKARTENEVLKKEIEALDQRLKALEKSSTVSMKSKTKK